MKMQWKVYFKEWDYDWNKFKIFEKQWFQNFKTQKEERWTLAVLLQLWKSRWGEIT
jgi:hypothetical protein